MNAFDAIAFIAERKIEEAMAEGQFDKLPGMGRPLPLEDLSHLPADMRMAYTLLKNGGYLDDRSSQNAPANMRELLGNVPEEKRIYGKMQRLKLMMVRVRKAEQTLLPGKNSKDHPDALDSQYLNELIQRV